MAIFKQVARRKRVVPLLLPTSCKFIFDMESSKDIHVKRKIATCWYQWHDPFSHYSPLKWPLHTRNAMIMWILMLIGVSETFFNFKYNVAFFLRVYMLIKSLVVFFRVHLEKNVALPIFLL